MSNRLFLLLIVVFLQNILELLSYQHCIAFIHDYLLKKHLKSIYEQILQYFFRFWSVNVILQTLQTIQCFWKLHDRFWSFLVSKGQKGHKCHKSLMEHSAGKFFVHVTFTFTLQKRKNSCIISSANCGLKTLLDWFDKSTDSTFVSLSSQSFVEPLKSIYSS